MSDRPPAPPSDPAKDPAAETPMQRALRLKTAAREAKNTPAGGRLTATTTQRQPLGASKPWLKR